MVSLIVDKLWKKKNLKKFLSKQLYSSLKKKTWLTARLVQCAGKQASGIVRGVRKKQEQRKFIIDKFISEKQFKKARKLQRIYDETLVSKPDINQVEPELDSRFVKINLKPNETSFDGWIELKSIGHKIKLDLPFKKHKHFNKMLKKGNIKKGIRISKKNITFMFDIKEPKKVKTGKLIGIDVGQTTTMSCSTGQTVEKDCHGHSYKSICEKLARKKKGSKAFFRAVTHRTNYINWSVHQLNLSDVKEVNIENIKHLRKGKHYSRYASHWNYAELFDRLETTLVDSGVQINKLNPAFTSQRCSCCGWVCERNRKEKAFKCVKCGFTADADLNASTNLSLPLVKLDRQQLLKKNKNFYWNLIRQEPIVPVAPKTTCIENFQYEK